MKKMMRKTFCIGLIAVLISLAISQAGFAAAQTGSNFEKAVDLKILGMFNGTDKGFELERVPNRVEGAVMLLRLLGKEQYALSQNYSHPFKDVPYWADRYVGYMYAAGLTKGTGSETFGAYQELTAVQYVTFILRALGYSDTQNDFKYEKALDKAVEAGLLSVAEAGSLKSASGMLRNDMVGISYNALTTKLKASSETLLDKLALKDRVISEKTAAVLGLYTSGLREKYGSIATYNPVSTASGYAVKNRTDLSNILKKSFFSYETTVKLDISNYNGDIFEEFEAQLNDALEDVCEYTGVKNIISSWEYVSKGNNFTLTLTYWYSKPEYQKKKQQAADALYKARHIVGSHIKPGMTDYEKELFIHDHIVNNTKYDYDSYLKGSIPDESLSPYGSLVLGKAVCQGYAEAFKLLSDLFGLECIIVEGKARGNGSDWIDHAWNIVKVGNSYYHVDATFDDPITSDGKDVLTYDYFNLTDSAMASSHFWNKADYPQCTATWLTKAG